MDTPLHLERFLRGRKFQQMCVVKWLGGNGQNLYGVIQHLHKQLGVGRWSVKCLHILKYPHFIYYVYSLGECLAKKLGSPCPPSPLGDYIPKFEVFISFIKQTNALSSQIESNHFWLALYCKIIANSLLFKIW